MGEWGNARKKTFFLIEAFPNVLKASTIGIFTVVTVILSILIYHLLPQDKDIIEPECEEGKEEKKGKHQTANCLLSSLVVVMNRMKLMVVMLDT